jgi:hypothetical protein
MGSKRLEVTGFLSFMSDNPEKFDARRAARIQRSSSNLTAPGDW